MTTTTAAQRREQAKHDYNAFLAACPTHQMLDTISDKWVCLILAALGPGPLRYGEIRTIVAAVSNKMLTQTLRTLERDGLVTRAMTAQVPVRVDYSLTPLGQTLLPVLSQLQQWAEGHMDDVLAARAEFDIAARE
ncbi:helix-turn-helix domain-containing protein [Nocardia sp. CDC153]|uniref:winged helix-turn-helix transcriptional regulator n=1 Tax=Nocardia sp. CDC153 TaxID=3112167 RepID=UPI002DB75586|nr:helix-turn-helix domain-containing protein [Nocardia sp. CDC153]MEC3956641.1 helix-turn-helix domain-containing protein [Nocardia sp. CDC153]